MRRIFTFCLCVLFSFTVLAQKSTYPSSTDVLTKHQHEMGKALFSAKGTSTYKLTNRNSDDMFEQKEFAYGPEGRVVAVYDDNYIYGDKVIDSIFYNNQGLVTEVRGFQFLNNVWKYVYYLLYSYDNDGNMTQRINFNSGGASTFEQGGVYDYVYSQGHIVSHTCYLGDHTTLIESCSYHYNSQNQLIEEKYLQGYGSLDSSYKYVYTYDANGRVESKKMYYYDSPSWSLNETEVFVYDSYGNCTDHSIKDATGQYIERRLYEYNTDYSSEDISMPYYIPELGYPEAFDDANMRTIEHWYAMDDNFVLQYICDYLYYYNGQFLSINGNEVSSNITVYPNPIDDVVSINISDEFGNISHAKMYDVQGKQCGSFNLTCGTNQLNMTGFESGLYILKIQFTNGKVLTNKIVKK